MAIPTIASYEIPTIPAHDGPSQRWSLDPQRAALLVHDMQHYFLAAYDHSASPIDQVLPNIKALITRADELGIPVYFSAQPPQQHLDRRGLLTDMWGKGLQTDADAAIVPDLAPSARHEIITKWRYSAFERTDLEQSLSFAKRDQLVITGVYGHMGCKVTAADAFMKDIQPFIVNDAIADFTDVDHAETVHWVNRRCGRALTTSEVLQQLR